MYANLCIWGVKQPLRDLQPLCSKVTVVAVGQLIVHSGHLSSNPEKKERTVTFHTGTKEFFKWCVHLILALMSKSHLNQCTYCSSYGESDTCSTDAWKSWITHYKQNKQVKGIYTTPKDKHNSFFLIVCCLHCTCNYAMIGLLEVVFPFSSSWQEPLLAQDPEITNS